LIARFGGATLVLPLVNRAAPRRAPSSQTRGAVWAPLLSDVREGPE
jgi:hypothetical protein